MFERIGEFAWRKRWPIVVIWMLATLIAVPFALQAGKPMKVGGFSSPGIESAVVADLIEERLSASASTFVVLFTSDTLDANERLFEAQVLYTLQPVESLPYVSGIIYPNDDSSLIAPEGRTAYALVGVDLPLQEAQRQAQEFRETLRTPPDLTVHVGGAPASYADIETMSQRDLRRAELIALPIALITLVIIFGSLVAASLPLIAGGMGVAGILLSLYLIAHLTDISIFALNLATMLGLGLAVDYSLFVTSRFREELRYHDGDVGAAIVATQGTAGKAVFFSGFTVLIGLSGLAMFDFMFLRSVGIAGVVVVVFSIGAAMTLLPALLGVVGTRIDDFRLIRRRAEIQTGAPRGFWVRLSHAVMKRPFLVLIPTTVLLLTLGAPFRHVRISSPDATILPPSLPSRQAFDLMVEEFGAGEISPFVVVLTTDGDMYSYENLGALFDITQRLAADPRIDHVRGLSPVGAEFDRDQAIALMQLQPRLLELGLADQSDRFISEDAAMILAYGRGYAVDEENQQLLEEIRSWSPGGDVELRVGGATAEIVDVVDKMYGLFPYAVVLILAATYLVLLVFFRSILLPVKAIVLNTLSILASYGALVWVFQDGHLNRLLNFTPLGYVEASLPIIMFCVLFGLSMDYEVFLLSRIREEWDRTGDNTASVALGLQRSGRIITSAALIVVVVTLSFATAEVILIKALGVGIAIAILIDATLIRALMVPASMRLMGRWNWWIPERLGRWLPKSLH